MSEGPFAVELEDALALLRFLFLSTFSSRPPGEGSSYWATTVKVPP